MGRDKHSDDEYWSEYERVGKHYVGSPEDIEELVEEKPKHRVKSKNKVHKLRKWEEGS